MAYPEPRARWSRLLIAFLAAFVAVVALAVMVGCGPKDEHREHCDKQGGVVGTQYDHNHNVKAHTCIVHGKTVDVWSAPAPTPEPVDLDRMDGSA